MTGSPAYHLSYGVFLVRNIQLALIASSEYCGKKLRPSEETDHMNRRRLKSLVTGFRCTLGYDLGLRSGAEYHGGSEKGREAGGVC